MSEWCTVSALRLLTMGCAASKIDKGEIVQRCKERKKLMKQLVGLRVEFAAAQMAYLRSLRNTGVTLRQFTDSESLELENVSLPPAIPPSPPPLPPSPPPPPPFSPDVRRVTDDPIAASAREDYIVIDGNNSRPPPPPAEFWDPFDPSPVYQKDGTQCDEDEDWVDTNTEFEEEKEDDVKEVVLTSLPDKSPARELMDDTSSMLSWYTKDTDTAMVVWRSKKTLAGIVKELDDYFLKASAGVKELALLLDTSGSSRTPIDNNVRESKGRSCKSAKVFSALSWSWSSKSLQSSRDSVEFLTSGEACKPGAHCETLDKLYAEELSLYERVKEEGIAQLQYEKKTLLLQKLEAGEHDQAGAESTRSCIEILESEISFLQHCINRTCLSIVKLRDEELYPQLVELSSGLMQVWRTMYECHQVQNHIAQQLNNIGNYPSTEPTSDYHIQATSQLEAEVTSWYNSFCNLLKSQRDYVRALNRWVQLTVFLPSSQPSDSSEIHAHCEEWQLALDRLPDKVAAEAIKSFLSVIHSIVLQHVEERKLHKKSDKLQRRLEKELHLLSKMETKFNEDPSANPSSILSQDHPLSIKRAKVEAFMKNVEDEKSKYLSSVRLSRAMTLNNLNTCLPNVFQALSGFSSVCAQAFEAIHGLARPANRQDETVQLQPGQS
ncbi:protein ALTERED PHOSPHATE STARVATION RESPONSE 1-like [Aristolochia californica]|uniref:protein ALTERED PHOSPHATE STARVATION RESPONSE 1-like n=1 Tax=Aristolochia californica TaxID=171875 RepID=UPI0035D66CED